MGDRDRKQHDIGKNLGQGLGNVTDQQRRDLAGSGNKAPTKDQAARPPSDERGAARGEQNRSS